MKSTRYHNPQLTIYLGTDGTTKVLIFELESMRGEVGLTCLIKKEA